MEKLTATTNVAVSFILYFSQLFAPGFVKLIAHLLEVDKRCFSFFFFAGDTLPG